MMHYVHKKIESISFGLFSPKQVVDGASAKIVTPELYDREGYPVDGGLMDLRLGVIDPGLRCKTCGQKLKECPGHFGYIELARPVVHIKFVRQVMDLLRSSCKSCGRVLFADAGMSKVISALDKLGEDEGHEARRRKIKEMVTKGKGKDICPHCTAQQVPIKLEKF